VFLSIHANASPAARCAGRRDLLHERRRERPTGCAGGGAGERERPQIRCSSSSGTSPTSPTSTTRRALPARCRSASTPCRGFATAGSGRRRSWSSPEPQCRRRWSRWGSCPTPRRRPVSLRVTSRRILPRHWPRRSSSTSEPPRPHPRPRAQLHRRHETPAPDRGDARHRGGVGGGGAAEPETPAPAPAGPPSQRRRSRPRCPGRSCCSSPRRRHAPPRVREVPELPAGPPSACPPRDRGAARGLADGYAPVFRGRQRFRRCS